MDNGCSNHITKKRTKLTNVDQVGQKKLWTTIGEPHDIEGKRRHIVPHNFSEIKILNFLYVLILMKSLMFIGVLVDINNILVFPNKYCWILNNMSSQNVIVVYHRDR